jgi:tetraacyldisaccharide 4'-kinase
MRFADHKVYTEAVIEGILEQFKQLDSPNKLLITTEKDAVKLRKPQLEALFGSVPLFYQPLEINFFDPYKHLFDTTIIDYVASAD